MYVCMFYGCMYVCPMDDTTLHVPSLDLWEWTAPPPTLFFHKLGWLRPHTTCTYVHLYTQRKYIPIWNTIYFPWYRNSFRHTGSVLDSLVLGAHMPKHVRRNVRIVQIAVCPIIDPRCEWFIIPFTMCIYIYILIYMY